MQEIFSIIFKKNDRLSSMKQRKSLLFIRFRLHIQHIVTGSLNNCFQLVRIKLRLSVLPLLWEDVTFFTWNAFLTASFT